MCSWYVLLVLDVAVHLPGKRLPSLLSTFDSNAVIKHYTRHSYKAPYDRVHLIFFNNLGYAQLLSQFYKLEN